MQRTLLDGLPDGLREVLEEFCYGLASQNEYYIREEWQKKDVHRAINILSFDQRVELLNKVMYSSNTGESDFINEYLDKIDDAELIDKALEKILNTKSGTTYFSKLARKTRIELLTFRYSELKKQSDFCSFGDNWTGYRCIANEINNFIYPQIVRHEFTTSHSDYFNYPGINTSDGLSQFTSRSEIDESKKRIHSPDPLVSVKKQKREIPPQVAQTPAPKREIPPQVAQTPAPKREIPSQVTQTPAPKIEIPPQATRTPALLFNHRPILQNNRNTSVNSQNSTTNINMDRLVNTYLSFG